MILVLYELLTKYVLTSLNDEKNISIRANDDYGADLILIELETNFG